MKNFSWVIDGGIASTIPGTNLYLMNPYGFMFGANAWISVHGSFHVTTADYLKMADRSIFYADFEANRIRMVGFGEGSEERINFTDLRSDTLDGIGGNVDVSANAVYLSTGALIISDSSGYCKGQYVHLTDPFHGTLFLLHLLIFMLIFIVNISYERWHNS